VRYTGRASAVVDVEQQPPVAGLPSCRDGRAGLVSGRPSAIFAASARAAASFSCREALLAERG
jgi:hypothetical protein